MNLFNQLKKVVTIDYPENQNNIRIFINRQNQEFSCTVYNANDLDKVFSNTKYDIKLIEEDNKSSRNWEIKLKNFNTINIDEIYDINVTLNKSRIEIKNILTIFNKNNIFSPNEKFIIVFESFGVPIGYNNRLIEYLEDLNQTRMENINNLRNNNTY